MFQTLITSWNITAEHLFWSQSARRHGNWPEVGLPYVSDYCTPIPQFISI